MADKALYILAGYDADTESRLSAMQAGLYAQGFAGTHTKGIPQHITLGSYNGCRDNVPARGMGTASPYVPFLERFKDNS